MSLKEFLLNNARLLMPAPLADLSFRLAYLSKLSRWLKSHPCPSFGSREALYKFVLETERLNAPVDYLEFGVFQGDSIRWWISQIDNPAATFVGFDCFEGLPQQWGSRPVGHFATGGNPPAIADRRCSFEVGLFQDTLPGFLRKNPRRRRTVVNHDEDLYSSTLFTLTQMAAYVQPNDILLFDDLGSARSPTHQFRALGDFCDAYGVSFSLLGVTKNGSGAALKVQSGFPSGQGVAA